MAVNIGNWVAGIATATIAGGGLAWGLADTLKKNGATHDATKNGLCDLEKDGRAPGVLPRGSSSWKCEDGFEYKNVDLDRVSVQKKS